MNPVERWLQSLEFNLFLQAAQESLEFLLAPETEKTLKEVQKKLWEMGNRYNHFIFQLTEFKITELKEITDSFDEIEREVLDFVKQVEASAVEAYPKLMKIYFNYRDQTRNFQSSSSCSDAGS